MLCWISVLIVNCELLSQGIFFFFFTFSWLSSLTVDKRLAVLILDCLWNLRNSSSLKVLFSLISCFHSKRPFWLNITCLQGRIHSLSIPLAEEFCCQYEKMSCRNVDRRLKTFEGDRGELINWGNYTLKKNT